MSRLKILDFGSLNYDFVYILDDFVLKGETKASLSYQKNLGGKGFNQAVALKYAGLDTYMAGKIGKDGDDFLNYLNKQGIKTKYLIKDDKDVSGHAIIEVAKGENRIILHGGSNQNITKRQIDKVLEDFDGQVVLLQNEISNIAYIINKAKQKGLLVIMNLSPFDDKVLTYPLAKVDIFLVNEIEAKALAKTNSDDIKEIINIISNKYKDKSILLTVGALGVYFIDKGKVYYQKAYKTNVVDTTGAGDTFTGYFISCYLMNKDIKKALKIASKASSIAITRKGAAISIPKLKEVIDG